VGDAANVLGAIDLAKLQAERCAKANLLSATDREAVDRRLREYEPTQSEVQVFVLPLLARAQHTTIQGATAWMSDLLAEERQEFLAELSKMDLSDHCAAFARNMGARRGDFNYMYSDMLRVIRNAAATP